MAFLRSKLLRNTLSLYSVQGLQYLVPLITLPLLVRALGTDGYGWISIAGAFGGYLQVVCDYGFQLSASRTISMRRDDTMFVSRQISSILAAKLFLAATSSIAALALLAALPDYRTHAVWLGIATLGSLASSFFPSWLFQGMERMGSMALISTVSRLLQLLLVVLLIRDRGDVALFLWISALMSLASTSAAWVLAIRRFKLRIILPKPLAVLWVLRDGFEIFLSQVGTLLFSNTNIMVLGALADPVAVGRYAIAEKIARIGIQLGGPVGSALYPRIAALITLSKDSAFRFLHRVLAWGSIAFIGIGLGMVLLAPYAVRFICGHPQPEILPLVWILSPLPLTIFVDNIFGTQVLLNSGHRRAFMTVPLTAGLLSLVLQAALIPLFGAHGAAASLLASELWILALFVWLAWKKTGFPFLSDFRNPP